MVTLRKFEQKDIKNKVNWVNDDRVNVYLHYDIPLSVDKTTEWFNKIKDNKNRLDCVIEMNGVSVGLIGLLDITEDSAEYYVMLGDMAYSGQGIAYEASKLLLEIAFREYGLNSLNALTEVDNIPAQKLFEKLSFKKMERINQSAKNRGQWVDRFYYVLEMGDYHD